MQSWYVFIEFGLKEVSGNWVGQFVSFCKIYSIPFWTVLGAPGNCKKIINIFEVPSIKNEEYYLLETTGPSYVILPPVCL